MHVYTRVGSVGDVGIFSACVHEGWKCRNYSPCVCGVGNVGASVHMYVRVRNVGG